MAKTQNKMYKILKTTDPTFGIQYTATKKSLSYFREELNPEFVLTNIPNLDLAIEIERALTNALNTERNVQPEAIL